MVGLKPFRPMAARYDNRIGLGVSAQGRAVFKEHANTIKYYVSTAGSDANDGLTPATAKATLSAGIALLRHGQPDWLMLRGGDSHSQTLGDWVKGGLDAQYPMIIRSYDGADPTNPAKYGKTRVTINTGSTDPALQYISGGVRPANLSYIAFMDLDFSPNGASPSKFQDVAGWHYVLVENCIFRHTEVIIQNFADTYTPGVVGQPGTFFIFRGNSVYGAYRTEPANSSNMYVYHYNHVTVEDNIFYHGGWGMSETRTAGADTLDHNVYLDNESAPTSAQADYVFRRNISAWASSHGLQMRPGGDCHHNVFISNPINLLHGGGDNYDQHQPSGVTGSVYKNVAIGSADINPSTPRGYGLWFSNSNVVQVFNNLVIHLPNLTNTRAFVAEATFAKPTVVLVKDNITYDCQRKGDLLVTPNGLQSNVITLVTENWLDATAAGGNLDSASETYPAPTRTVGTYYQSIGGTNDEQAFLEAAKLAPEDPKFRALALLNYLFAGYGR